MRAACSCLLVLLFAAACRLDSRRELAVRIIDRYRRTTGAKPLPSSHVIRMRVRSESGEPGGEGVAEIAWAPNRYRERISSAGWTVERGIQGAKAYFIDEDGVSRVVSDPVLREFFSRWYFWRRGWLFEDRERARVSVAGADSQTASVQLVPSGGNPLILSFSRGDSRLIRVRSPRFDLDFTGSAAFREATGHRPAVRAEIVWQGLPTGPISDATVGGGCGRFVATPGRIPFERSAPDGLRFPARLNGIDLRLALDASIDGPVAVSPRIAKEIGLPFARDVWGRVVAAGASLEAGGFSCPRMYVQALSAAPEGVDGVAGATFFRESVVELDPGERRLAFHDPTGWVAPDAFTRVAVDDDGNRPVATLVRHGDEARVLLGAPSGASDLLLVPQAAARLGIPDSGTARGLHWGALGLPELSIGKEPGNASPAWGDDGRLGFGVLLRFHSHLDMGHRWIYLRPVAGTR